MLTRIIAARWWTKWWRMRDGGAELLHCFRICRWRLLSTESYMFRWFIAPQVVDKAMAHGGEVELLRLARRFRACFVEELQPRFLPPAWQVDHE